MVIPVKVSVLFTCLYILGDFNCWSSIMVESHCEPGGSEAIAIPPHRWGHSGRKL